MRSDLKKRIKSANAKILNMERKYGKDSKVVKRVYATLRNIYGEDRTRYRFPTKEESLRNLNKIDRGVQLIEKSLYASKAGRKELRKKIEKSFGESHEQFSDKEVADLFYIFEHSTDWDKIREMAGVGNSDLTLDAINRAIEMKYSRKEVMKMMRDYRAALKGDGTDMSFDRWLDNIVYGDK